MNFNDFVEHHLNESQKKAVLLEKGPLLVCAGAGSGKTRVITARITHLMLNHAVEAHAIVALTFTNKAAREMKARINTFLHGQATPYVGTFHAYCLRVLKQNQHRLPFPEFSIFDSADQESLAKKLITKCNLTKKITAKNLLHAIASLKNEAVTGSVHPSEVRDPILRELFILYEHEKKMSHCFDFDDLLLETVKLFHRDEEFKKSFQQTVRHVLIDEYQDTNEVQHALLKHMALTKEHTLAIDSVCVVGDEDQSIYSWRGATVANIMNFKKDFAHTTTITVEQNYRSVDQILAVANTLIENNTYRNPKNLWSSKKGEDRVRLVHCTSGYQESEIVAHYAKTHLSAKNGDSFAVLYRSHYQSRSIEEALLRHSIAYSIIGGIRFYERLEIKDILCYLRLVANPFDRVAFSRVINTPSRGLGDKFQELFLTAWEQQPFASFLEAAQQLLISNELTPTRTAALQLFISVFEGLTPTMSAHEAFEHIIKRTLYFSYIKESFDKDEAQAKIENVKELGHAIAALQERGIMSVSAFLDEVALIQDTSSQQEEGQGIMLMTFHAAKGLEFHTVCLVGIEEGILPSAHAMQHPDNVEEERRLLYVGITRAEERLLLSHSRYRYTYGTMTDQQPSRFIKEFSQGPLTVHDASSWSTVGCTHFFNQWLGIQVKNQFQEFIRPEPHVNNRTAHTLETLNVSGSWKLGQRVHHTAFGSGTIQEIEPRGNDTFLVVRFAHTTKKVAASFVST